MTEQRPVYNVLSELDAVSIPDEQEAPLDFERVYLAEHARCLELEKQLDSLRDAARKVLLYQFESDNMSDALFYAMGDLQNELNKE